MTRNNRPIPSILKVTLLREGIAESTHRAIAVVCDDRGRLLAEAGDAKMSTFIRSALKPFQAIAVTSTGTIERYGLSDPDLAIICSSHQGTIEQTRQVFNVLWRSDVDPAALQCPVPVGKSSPLEHNCSGKHAGMLAVCQQRLFPLENYLHRSHPIQKLIVGKLGELLKMPADELIRAKDDCGAPTYAMTLDQMATLYAQLSSGQNLELERVVRAMTHYPQLIGGNGHFDTELMRLTEGELVSKAGAEGIQCVGRVGQGLGLAIKVLDGAKRAKYAVALHILRQLGWLNPTLAEPLIEQFMMLSEFKRLEVTGELTML
ncbi:MAG: asparaginase [Spirulina sp. SIO3F2]|nr:asparaginase [Spirulina sp. SIO3F2]